MTKIECQAILQCDEVICLSNSQTVTVDAFLDIAGFKDCEPNLQAMIDFDGGTKGYRDFLLQLSD